MIIIMGILIPGKAESSSMTQLKNTEYDYRDGQNNALNRIRIQRLWRGLTLEDCAKQMGLSINEARHQENPQSDLRISQLLPWAIVLRVPIVFLIQQAPKFFMSDINNQDDAIDNIYDFFDDPETLIYLRKRLCELVNLTQNATIQLENNISVLANQAYDCFTRRYQADLRTPRPKTNLKNALTTTDEDGLEIFNIPEGALNTVFITFLREERSFKIASKILKFKSVEEFKRRIHHKTDLACSELQWFRNYLNVPFTELVCDDVVSVNVYQDRALIVKVLKIVNLIRLILEKDLPWCHLSKSQSVLYLQILDCTIAFCDKVFQHEKRFNSITAASKTGRIHGKRMHNDTSPRNGIVGR